MSSHRTPVGPAGDGTSLTPPCLKNTQVYVVQLGLRGLFGSRPGLICHHVSHLRCAGWGGVRGRERSGLREGVWEARQHLRFFMGSDPRARVDGQRPPASARILSCSSKSEGSAESRLPGYCVLDAFSSPFLPTSSGSRRCSRISDIFC